MFFLRQLKSLGEGFPEPFGRLVCHVPFWLRLGRGYVSSYNHIEWFHRASHEEQKGYAFHLIVGLLRTIIPLNSFYKFYYQKKGFDISQMRSFDDIKKIPLVSKGDLSSVDLSERSNTHRGDLLINTGGTSGNPLEFYVDRNAFAREWAHMHFIWGRLGYRSTDLKLTFRGRNLGTKPLVFNSNHNEYMVNIYQDGDIVADAIQGLCRRRVVSFLHGYPSAIYDFALYCLKKRPKVLDVLRRSLRGILLASEYPLPMYRDTIENTFCVPSLSWYGHSEMAILAYERDEKGVYFPLQTYGYCEAVLDPSGQFRLVGTSYYNTSSPFIRYDTGDVISPVKNGEILESFKIDAGRVGDFIVDSKGHRISLTGLIFGRHHRIFGKASFVQVRQKEPGKATILVTIEDDGIFEKTNLRDEFDLSHVAVSFDFERLKRPILSRLGKVPLVVN